MARMDSQQKAIANVFLDMISAVDVTGETALPDGWIAPFVDRLAEIEAATIDSDESGTVRVDITPMVSSAALLVGVLVELIATEKDADRLAVVHTLREHIERNL